MSVHRSLLGSIRSARQVIKLTGAIPLAALLERIAIGLATAHPSIVVSDWRDTSESIDLRGRPRESFDGVDSTPGSTFDLAEKEEELLAVEATFGKGRDPIRVALKSRFSRFEHGTIVYGLHFAQFGLPPEIARFLTLRRIARLLPLRIESARIGLEFFRKRLFAGTIGLTPTISGRFYLTSSRESLSLTVENLACGDRDTPLDRVISVLDEALRSLELYPDLKGELQLT